MRTPDYGSGPGTGSGSCSLRQWHTFTSVFKDIKSSRSHKTVEIKVFNALLLVDGRIRIQSHIQIQIHKNIYGSGSWRPKNLYTISGERESKLFVGIRAFEGTYVRKHKSTRMTKQSLGVHLQVRKIFAEPDP
jgi:hypothetical protein